MPIVNIAPWSPPGIEGPWPHDEYLEDGGDTQVPANLGRNRDVHGLELEDTVAVYDTIDGETKIQPSNRVCLYSPRFAAVRQVTSVIENLQNDQLTAVSMPLLPQLNQLDSLATTVFPSQLVINPLLGPTREDYAFYPGTQLLLGSRYAIVRPEIRRIRPIRAQEPAQPFRIMVALGDDDLGVMIQMHVGEVGAFAGRKRYLV